MNDDSTNMNAQQVLVLKIFGEPASKANSRKVVMIGGVSRLIKSSKALSYASAFKRQANASKANASKLHALIEGDVVVHITIWYASRRSDLDESLILDLLQGVFYKNDRQVKEKHIYWALDPQNPRCEIRVEPLGKK